MSVSTSRSEDRNVWVEFASSPGVVQGGLCAAPNLTQRQFLDMLDVAFTANGGFEVRMSGSSTAVTPTSQRLEHGRYILTPCLPDVEMRTSDERFYPRTLSVDSTLRDARFRAQVRLRDGRCVITGRNVRRYYHTFHAAHIFPLALSHIFHRQGFSQLITHNDPPGINSPQNGLLLSALVHPYWDDYFIAVNPNDGYQVQSFQSDAWEFHGNVLSEVCRQPGDQLAVLDVLLRWHYEQAVLCNMRRAGEPCFEFDFPPGTDMMGEIRQGPQPEARMEAELFNRLYGWDHPQSPGIQSG